MFNNYFFNNFYRLNDFKWWLVKCVNFDAPVWGAGISHVLAGYKALKDYIALKRAMFAKFATTSFNELKIFDNSGSLTGIQQFLIAG